MRSTGGSEAQIRCVPRGHNANKGLMSNLFLIEGLCSLARGGPTTLVQDSESSDSIAQLALQNPWESGLDRIPTRNESLTFAQLY
jgi:hypothetical protein